LPHTGCKDYTDLPPHRGCTGYRTHTPDPCWRCSGC
jgi:hypothetical protein